MLAVYCNAQGLTVQKSEIPQADSGSGLPNERDLGDGQVIGFYHGSVMYAELTREQQRTKHLEKKWYKQL